MLPCNKCTEFCKNTLHKNYNSTTYSNITIERTLHKIIITHITFIFTKRSYFKQFKHMMHIIYTQLLCRHLECYKTPGSSFIYPLLSFPLDTSFPGQLPQEPPGCRMAVVMKALAVGSLVSARAQACKCVAHAVPFETAFSFLFCCQVM